MIKKHKLTIINNGYVSRHSLGGGDRYAMEVASRLKGFDITVITPPIGYRHWRRMTGTVPVKCHFRVLNTTLFDDRDNPIAIFLAYVLRAQQTRQVLTALPQPDIILSISDLFPDAIPAYLYRGMHPHSRWAVNIGHLVEPPRRRQGSLLVNAGSWLLQRIILHLMRSSDLVLADNRWLASALAKTGINRDRIQIHYGGGVDVQKIRNYKPKRRTPHTAVFVGRLAPHKGSFDLPMIWKEVVRSFPDATLAIVGDGPKNIVRALREQIREYDLGKNIHLLGFLEHQKKNKMPLFDVLKNSQLLLFTDHEAGLGLSVIEAMAAGLPIVAYDLPIFGTTYKRGFVTAPLKDTRAFATNVIALLQNQKRYAKLRKGALLQSEEFDWKRIIGKLNVSLASH